MSAAVGPPNEVCLTGYRVPGAPNSPKQVQFTDFKPQSRYYLYTWSPWEWICKAVDFLYSLAFLYVGLYDHASDAQLQGPSYGSFRKLGVPYFGLLIIRILLFKVLY